MERMDSLIAFSCSNCDYVTELALGAGRAAILPEKIAPLFPEKAIKNFRSVVERRQLAYFKFEQKLGWCSACQTLQAVPTLVYRERGNIAKQVLGVCAKCGQSVRILPLEQACCPICQGPLKQQSIGLWD